MNLSGQRTALEVARGLVLDALALVPVLPEWDSLVDLGSGAGFPGLPLAILHPERRILLVESRERRHHFQRAAARQLGLGQVAAVHGRAELLAPETVELALAQAVGPPERVGPWLARWLRPGGTAAIPQSADAAAPRSWGTDLLEPLPPRSYPLPLGGQRQLWLARRELVDRGPTVLPLRRQRTDP